MFSVFSLISLVELEYVNANISHAAFAVDESLRNITLDQLNQAYLDIKKIKDLDLGNLKIVFERGGSKYNFPLWNLINGPIADALYHTGQIVSFRRTSGNPIPKGVNVFLGIKN
mgnify:CR=1 FL=1